MPIFRGAPPNFSGRKKRNSLLRRERESEEKQGRMGTCRRMIVALLVLVGLWFSQLLLKQKTFSHP